MGCGRVGSALAQTLAAEHSVAIIDRDEAAFRRLHPFDGHRVVGIGFDRETLITAGIERAYAFAAVSSGDNSNILAARLARENFGVKHVVARIYDPGRAEVYERLGIPSVATLRSTTDQVLRRLLPQQSTTVHQEPSGRIGLVELVPHESWIGVPYDAIDALTHSRLAYVMRLGRGHMPRHDLVVQQQDVPYFAIENDRRHAFETLLLNPKVGQ